jgi:phosphoserine aminotransferase
MISFYPGPSRVYSRVSRYLQDAYKQGILSINHRSEEFESIFRKTTELLNEKLNIPETYSIYFVSSATECWEIIAQSLIEKESIHIHNGAFGKKWFTYTKRLKPGATSIAFDLQTPLNPAQLKFKSGDTICLTQNETSNGTQVSNKILQKIRKNNPDHLIAIDATSSMGGIEFDFTSADVWFASVQKCLGLPAGLGLLICSPAARAQAQRVDQRLHYNSLLFLDDMMKLHQTSYTPNVLDIYLLMRVLEDVKPIQKIDKMIRSRYKKWEAFFDTKSNRLNFLVKNKAVRSHSVLAIETAAELLQTIKAEAKKSGFILGNGYGDWKETTFRIANFPALKRTEIARLMDFLYRYI